VQIAELIKESLQVFYKQAANVALIILIARNFDMHGPELENKI
jgi:hypothetical protein